MMRAITTILASTLVIIFCPTVFGQKIIGDCTITYGLQTQNNSGVDSNTLKNASKTFYVRGGMSLTEIRFNGFLQSTIYNKSGDKAYVLYDMDGEKYMSVLNNKQWLEQYNKYKDLKIEVRSDRKKILGYLCTKAVATLKDGTKINLYYTPELKTTVSENPYEFSKIDGLVLEYESQVGNKYNVIYTATHIDFDPVPAAKFIIPKEGYRLLDNHQLPGK